MVVIEGNNYYGAKENKPYKNVWADQYAFAGEWPKETRIIANRDVNRVLARRMVTGKWNYAADIKLPGMLFARLKLSPYPHAKVVSIDTSEAEAMEGVKAVLTYRDHTVMQQETKFQLMEVAAVAATDPYIAEEAVRKIKVTYDEQAFILDPDEAMAPGAPNTGVFETNVLAPTEITRGDVAAGLAEADVTIEDTVGWTEYMMNPYIETRSCTAMWQGDYLTVWTSSQNPFFNRTQLANELNLPMNMVRVISHGSGAGYGDKHVSIHNVIAALLAKKAGAPVELHLSREENHGSTSHQFRQRHKIKIGAKSDGTLTAIDVDAVAEWCGGWGTYPAVFSADGISTFRVTYTVPNGRWKMTTVGVNKPATGAYRDVGQPPSATLQAIVMWELAEKLNMDPVDLYLKNVRKPGDLDQESGLPIASVGVGSCIEKGAEAFGWTTRYHAPGTRTLPNGRMHGVGFSAVVNNKGRLSSGSGTVVFFTPDGVCNLATGLSSSNGGSTTGLACIVAEALGLASIDDVQVRNPGDTATNQDSGGEGGSTRVITAGSGALVAALDARQQLFDVAADMLEVTPEELDASNGLIFVSADPARSLPIKDVAARANRVYNAPVIGRGSRARPPGWDMKTACATFAEIEVDTETGHIYVTRLVNAADVGRAVHYKGCRNQLLGGNIQRMAQAHWQTQEFDEATGISLNANFYEMRHVTFLDMPEVNEAVIIESIDPIGPFGAKGLGEPAVTNQVGAIMTAFYNATGVWIKENPLYPWRVLKALGEA